MYECLQEEAGGEPSRHDGDVVPHTIALLVQSGGKVLDHLPHELEVGVVEDVVVLDEVPVVLPNPFLKIRTQTERVIIEYSTEQKV